MRGAVFCGERPGPAGGEDLDVSSRFYVDVIRSRSCSSGRASRYAYLALDAVRRSRSSARCELALGRCDVVATAASRSAVWTDGSSPIRLACAGSVREADSHIREQRT